MVVNNIRSLVLARHHSIRIGRLGKMKCSIVMAKSVKFFSFTLAAGAFRMALTRTLENNASFIVSNRHNLPQQAAEPP